MNESKNVEVKLVLKDELSQQSANAEKNFKTSMSTMEKAAGKLVAAIGGLIAIDKIVGFAKRGVAEFQQEALASARLTQALGFQSDALKKLSEQSAKLTLYKDDEIATGQATLAMYVKNEEAIKRLTPVMLDMAVQTGSTDSAAYMLGKTFSENIDTIGRTGIKVHGLTGRPHWIAVYLP